MARRTLNHELGLTTAKVEIMNPLAIRVFDGPIADAHEAASSERSPIVVPSKIYCDDRGWSLMNQLQGVLSPQGQINFAVIYPSVVKAWHRHHKQTDFWICLTGNIKVGVHCEQTGRSWLDIIGEKRPGVMIIPPPLWHGLATVGSASAGLLYYVTRRYDPNNPDEDRRPYDSVEGFPWAVRHG